MSACKKGQKEAEYASELPLNTIVDYYVVFAAKQDRDHHYPHHILHHYGAITTLARVLINIRISCDLEFRCSSTTTSNL